MKVERQFTDADIAKMKRVFGTRNRIHCKADVKDQMNAMLKGVKPVNKAMGGKVQKMNMGGEVMDTTKAMPVGMMDGGKVKPMKMNMGGVIPGRGGMFKGMK